MRRTILIALTLVVGASFCQAGKKKTQKAVEKPVERVALNSAIDSLSYCGGITMTNGLKPFLLQQGLDTAYMADFIQGFRAYAEAGEDPRMKARALGMDIAKQVAERLLPGLRKGFEDTPDSISAPLFYQGFTAALEGDTTLFTQQAAEAWFQQRQKADEQAKTERLTKAGRDFLAENAKREGVITLPSGLQYKVLQQGEGQVPTADDRVLVRYEGRLIDGTVFDASDKHGEGPAEFSPSQVIKGWTEALTMMPVGSKWQLYIPYDLAYGERGAGADIKPYSTLIFDVELVDIVKK